MYENESYRNQERPSVVSKRPMVIDICFITAKIFFFLGLIVGIFGFITSKGIGFTYLFTLFLGNSLFCLFVQVLGEIVNQLAIANYNMARRQ